MLKPYTRLQLALFILDVALSDKTRYKSHTPFDLHEADPKRFPACFNSAETLAERIPEVLGEHYTIHYPGHQSTTTRNLRTTPLHEEWENNNAHFGQFFGWERSLYFDKKEDPELTFGKPVWFEQVKKEVGYAHTKAAIFDQSTFGKIAIEGNGAEAFLNRVCANDMTREPGRAIYTAMLNERGGFESDLTALRLDAESYRLYVGTSAIKRDMAWLKRHLQSSDKVTLRDETEQYAVLGLMGPDVVTIANNIDADWLTDLGYFQHGQGEISGVSALAARMSYVGEAGWEITCATSDATTIYKALNDAGAKPAGIFAQTSMRIEKRFLAFGHDLDTDINPLQAGLDFAVDWNSDFIGHDALVKLRELPVTSTMVSIILDDVNAVPLGNEPVYCDGKIIGKTTSAAFGYRIGKPVALAYIRSESLSEFEGARVDVDIARSMYSGILTCKPACDAAGSRMKGEF